MSSESKIRKVIITLSTFGRIHYQGLRAKIGPMGILQHTSQPNITISKQRKPHNACLALALAPVLDSNYDQLFITPFNCILFITAFKYYSIQFLNLKQSNQDTSNIHTNFNL